MAPRKFKDPKGMIAHEWPLEKMVESVESSRLPGYDAQHLELPRHMYPKEHQYVVGLMFTEDRRNLLLIKKAHPEWQAGKMNGTGGKLRDGETVRDAMVREHLEEAGIDTVGEQWGHLCTLEGQDWRVWYFVTFDDRARQHHPMTCEHTFLVRICSTRTVPWTLLSSMETELIYNLTWIIPMALDDTLSLPLTIGEHPR